MNISEHIDQFDRAVDLYVDRLRGNRVFDRLFYTASAIGDFSIVWYFTATVLAIGPGGNKESLRLGVCLAVESMFINGLVKSMFRRSRPVHDGPRPHRLRMPRTSSFPSGHATSGFMSAVLLSDGQPEQIPLWFTLAAIVGLSRVYVRIHHASDVIGGMAIGLVMGLGVISLWQIR